MRERAGWLSSYYLRRFLKTCLDYFNQKAPKHCFEIKLHGYLEKRFAVMYDVYIELETIYMSERRHLHCYVQAGIHISQFTL